MDLLKLAAKTCGISLQNLFHFIVFRQMEAFLPVGTPGCFKVNDDAVQQVLRGIKECSSQTAAIAEISGYIKRALDTVANSGKEPPPRLAAWTMLTKDIGRQAFLTCEETEFWFRANIMPALMERAPQPLTLPQKQGKAA